MYNQTDPKDQALLNALAKQAMRAPIPMTFTAFVISGLAYEKVPTQYILVWLSMVIGMQILRVTKIRDLAKKTAIPGGKRLKTVSLISLINGLVLASSTMFFSSFDEISRAVYSMIMIGMVAGTIATSHGYRPVFIGFVLPILTSVSIAWLLTGSDTLTLAISVLMTTLGVFMYISSRDVYASFIDGFSIRQELETALDSERSANAAKTRFLAAASHDLRQPLHAMSMLSAALTVRDLDERSSMIAEKMNSAMSDLSNELDSLLDISKLDAGVMRVRPTYFNVCFSISNIISSYEELSKRKGINLVLLECKPVFVEIDKALFERVIRNLLDNAIKYTKSGSVTLGIKINNQHCSVFIEDTGIGIPLNEQEKIREEFYQLNNPQRDRQKGLGLGLSIVWRLIPLIDGSLSMESELGKGTKYLLTIPTSPERTDKDITDRYLRTPSDLKAIFGYLEGTSVLLIEDDKDVRLSTRMLLENCGLVVYEATGTREATTIAQHENIDIALVDLRLRGSDNGFTTISYLRSIQPDIPIIILSGETSPAALKQAETAQCEFIVKPVDMTTLIAEISNSLKTE